MRIPDKRDALGDIPERFDAVLADALREEAKPVNVKRFSMVWLVALLIIALTCTALAVATQYGILDFMSVYSPESGDASTMIETSIAQTGGEGTQARFTVREAIYDGGMLHFLIACTPANEDMTLFWEPEVLWSEEAQDAKLGEAEAYSVGFEGEIIWDGERNSHNPFDLKLHGGSMREAQGLIFYASKMLPSDLSMEAVQVSTTFTIADLHTGEMVETVDLAFEVPRTAEAEVQSFPMNTMLNVKDPNTGTAYPAVRLDKVEVSHTLIQTTIAVYYKPLMAMIYGTDYFVVGEDGVVNYLVYGNDYGLDAESDAEVYRTIVPSGSEMPAKLVLWPRGLEGAIVLDTRAGTATCHPAEVTLAEDYAVVKVDEEVAYE